MQWLEVPAQLEEINAMLVEPAQQCSLGAVADNDAFAMLFFQNRSGIDGCVQGEPLYRLAAFSPRFAGPVECDIQL